MNQNRIFTRMQEDRTDIELWALIKRDDSRALALLFRRYYFILLRQGMQIVQDPELLKDAANELFYRIWLRRTELSQVENINSYLRVMYRNQLLLEIKQQKKQDEQLKIYSHTTETGELSYEDILVGIQVKTEQKLKLKQAFEQLTPRQKEYLRLNFYDGMSYEQIALQTGQTVKTVYNTTYEALKKLRQQIIL